MAKACTAATRLQTSSLAAGSTVDNRAGTSRSFAALRMRRCVSLCHCSSGVFAGLVEEDAAAGDEANGAPSEWMIAEEYASSAAAPVKPETLEKDRNDEIVVDGVAGRHMEHAERKGPAETGMRPDILRTVPLALHERLVIILRLRKYVILILD